MEPINVILSNLTGGQLIVFLIMCILVSLALQIASWLSMRQATKKMCEMVKREHEEHREMLASIARMADSPRMSDPLPPERGEGGMH